MLLNCMYLTTQGQTINTMLFVFSVQLWNHHNNHKIGCHKMKNKLYDTIETDPQSHSKIVERVKIDTPSIHILDRSFLGLVQTIQYNVKWIN